MDMQAFAAVATSRVMQNVQTEIGVRVMRMSLDAQAASAALLLQAQSAASGIGQHVNLTA